MNAHGEFRWQGQPSVAWVEGPERVCLVDLRRVTDVDLLLCPEPAASLWRAVADGPMGEAALRDLATDLVGEDGDALITAFLSAFTTQDLLEEAA